MKHLYTAYLTYPYDIDSTIREIHSDVSAKWINKRTFEFKPMIPLWKVVMSSLHETELISNLQALNLSELPELQLKGFEKRKGSGYIFIVFNDSGSENLYKLSELVSMCMKLSGSVDFMRYGFEPHTSLIKQDPSEIEAVYSSLPTNLPKNNFPTKQLVISKEIKNDHGSIFEVIYSFTPLPTGIGKPAIRALHKAGCNSIESLASLSEQELVHMHGVGPKAVGLLSKVRALA